MTREQQIKIQRCIDEFYSNRPQVRDELGAALQVLYEAELIVYCKDCKYYGRVDKRRFYRGSDCLNNHIDTIVPDRDYCSKGERREDGE